ncbi:MAG: S-adenosylmethionine-binding protein [Candidatus Sericytochromatia bacterium]|uniref:S-adenosylmethionine-binding protein n=1 Tax=Candidatus Tanganyikabacteria bacterium TaxID=2961651 RepID=A0A937X1Z3_9BACT|nr:S-adenosylmethionine-binding protein [Candidatus Tanganyikabacteria bacterium]
MSLAYHPIANAFPLIEGAEFKDLVQDVRVNGLHEPIWLYEEAILDGRNRYRACLEAEVEPRFKTYSGDDPIGFVVSLNLKRRHLNESQRAMVAAKLANLGWGGNRRSSDHVQGANLPLELPSQTATPVTVAQAAEMLNVSERSVKTAREVQQEAAPELIRAVEAGEVAVSTAAALTELPKEEQAEVVARGEKEILAAAKKIRQRKTEKRREERIEIVVAQTVPLESIGRYPILLADPPWQYDFAETDNRAIENQYPTMALGDLMDLPVHEVATDNALLFLWTTPPKACDAFCLLQAWGFDYVSQWIWIKDKIGAGYWGRAQHELVYVCKRGEFPAPAPDVRPPSVFNSARDAHSAKPAEVHERIERMYPTVPKVELFARKTREGWAIWGNQAPAGAA